MRKRTVEEYLERIYAIQMKNGVATTGQIADEMEIRPPSVTQMVQKLAEEGLVEYNPYMGVKVTAKGETEAKALLEKHKVLEEFLTLIGVDKDKAEEDACRIEHHVSSMTVDQLRKFVNFMKENEENRKLFVAFDEEHKK